MNIHHFETSLTRCGSRGKDGKERIAVPTYNSNFNKVHSATFFTIEIKGRFSGKD